MRVIFQWWNKSKKNCERRLEFVNGCIFQHNLLDAIGGVGEEGREEEKERIWTEGLQFDRQAFLHTGIFCRQTDAITDKYIVTEIQFHVIRIQLIDKQLYLLTSAIKGGFGLSFDILTVYS